MKQDNKLLGLLAGSALAIFAVAVTAQDEAAAPAEAAPAETELAPEAAADAAPVEEAAAEAAPEEAAAPPVKPLPAEIMPLASRSLLLDVVNTGERLVAVGDRGHILVSNNGKDWAQVVVPVRSALTAVTFTDPKNGWAVGHDAVILHTQDGGKTWALQNFQPQLEKPLLDVLFLDTSRGLAVGAYGLFYETTDGGQNWTEVQTPIRAEELHFNSIARLNNGDLLIAGEQGTLAISADGGTSWTKLTSPYESSLFGAVALGEKGAVIFGLRGNVYVSGEPRSNSWTKVDTGTVASMFGGVATADGGVAMVGLNGTVLVMDGSGGNLRSLRSTAGTPLSGAITLGAQSLLAVGESGAQSVKLQ
ncbi:MAG TPA: YCF48-related protein [Solimonas sp.]|nr:YCF48-related protein [Solimonas sp.]